MARRWCYFFMSDCCFVLLNVQELLYENNACECLMRPNIYNF